MVIIRKFISILLLTTGMVAGAQRLPTGVVPEHYALTFTPDLAAATFSGSESIQVNVQRAGNTLTLNSLDLQIQKASVTQGQGSQEARVSLDPAKEQATLTLALELTPGPATIQIQFAGILNNQLRGFYLAETKLRRYATTQFEATDARRAFPCFDEPAQKATFDITLVVDNGDTAISNGRIISDVPGPGAGKHSLTFSTTPRMSTYLVAMAVGDFQCNEGQADGIPVRVCGTPDKKPMGQAALRYAEEILKYYNQYFSVKYPYGKLDILGLPDFEAGAMENTAAIFYRESLLFIDDKNSSVDSHFDVFVVLAHEMSHQWFGDLVTMKWWDNVWLNEGFANWMEKKPAQVLHPDWNSDLDAVKDTNEGLELDALRNTHPIRARAEGREEIDELFDPISYNKGAAVMRMLESYLSPEVFRRGVNAYLRKFQYSNATAEDFWNTMAEASGRPVERIMPTFVNLPGEPLVSVKATCATAKAPQAASARRRRSPRPVQPHPKTEITLAQQRFLIDGSIDSSQPWLIPICIKTDDNKPFCQLLGERQQAVPVVGCSSWVFANANAVGYYRTQYDPEDLKKIRDVAATRLSVAERMSLVDDQVALIRAGKESISSLLDLISAVNADPHHAVVESYIRTLEFIDGYMVTGAERENYHLWLRSSFRPMLAKLGWAPAAGENEATRDLRADVVEILGNLAEDPDTIAQATTLARQYLHDPNSIDPTLAERLLGVAARSGDARLLDEYLDALRDMSAPEQYDNVGLALPEFRGPELVARVLEASVSPAIRSQDAPYQIAAVLRNPANRDFAWQWIKTHWPDVEKKTTAGTGAEVVLAARSFCDAKHRDDVLQFFTQHQVPSADRVLKQVVEQINSCISYRDGQQSNLAAWLGAHSGGTAAGQN